MNKMLEAFRFYFKTLGAVAPKLAGWHAARLFLTPVPRRSASRWSDALTASARRESVRFAGGTLDTWVWGEGPRVLLVHGWGGLAAHLAALIQPLVSAGFEVVAFDGPGHGAARGKRTNLWQFSDCILQLERESPHGIKAVLGHSFGASALMVALHRGLAPDAVVLVSPFSSSDRNIESFSRVFQLPAAVARATRERLLTVFAERHFIWDLAKLAAHFTQPALLLHDETDREVPISESQAIHAHWSGSRLHATKGLGHHLILRDQAVVEEAKGFLADRILAPASAERSMLTQPAPQRAAV